VLPETFRLRCLAALLMLAGLVAQPALSTEAVAPPRFSGLATLTAAAPSSDDGRFTLQAALSVQPSGTDRYQLRAKLRPDPKSVAGTCGPLGDAIFGTGFE